MQRNTMQRNTTRFDDGVFLRPRPRSRIDRQCSMVRVPYRKGSGFEDEDDL
eukprot:CAMPEP_0168271292 /NCGR_PEP_ID=MMETSP0141_2-20121125/15514_1 /TAXON_ID=44445 /ORGANISM="Pseudo-nitzschia australis, Strain 10249 10 AB" /LENGTH=50 /DNA_ID=CAMNT_0008212457 /DNA_START=362 /DNA_END=510 /DNA_ORIENTATION=-